MASPIVPYIDDFGAFLWAILTTWSNLYTGGVIVAIVALYHGLRKKAPSQVTVIVMSIVFLVLACFNVWRVTRPGLHLHIDEVSVSQDFTFTPISPQAGDQVPSGIPGTLVASIWNLGNPSVADTWDLSIRLPDKTVIRPTLFDVRQPDVSALNLGNEHIPLSKLLFKETLAPLATGDKKQGVIMFFVNGFTQQQLIQKGTIIDLSCHDVSGNQISTEFTLTGVNQRQLHFPGLE